MSLFDSIYRLYGTDDMDPSMMQDPPPMQDVGFEEDPEGLGLATAAQPRMIPPQQRGYARPGFDTYLQHIKSMPQEGDFEASTGRKIAAALVGLSAGLKNPGAGYQMAEQIMRSPYTRALSDWQSKGQELGSLTTEEGKFIGNMSDENIEAGKLGARHGELQAKVDQINRNYDVALRNAKTAAERNTLTQQRNADLKALGEEANKIDRIQAGAATTQAGAAKTRANAYSTWVDQQPSPGEGRVVPPKIGDMQEAEQDILMEMMQEDPALIGQFFQFNSDTGYVDPKFNDEMSPEELAQLQAIKAMIGARSQKRLGGQGLGGAPPVRPRVITPPNRRRNP